MKNISLVFAETALATLVCGIFGTIVSIAIQAFYTRISLGDFLSPQYLLFVLGVNFVSIFIPLIFFNLLKHYLSLKGAK